MEPIWDHEPWMDRGACRNPMYDPDLWSSGDHRDIERAKSICEKECPVKAECLVWALAKDEKHHVCGALTRGERNYLQRSRR